MSVLIMARDVRQAKENDWRERRGRYYTSNNIVRLFISQFHSQRNSTRLFNAIRPDTRLLRPINISIICIISSVIADFITL